jgi:asparagine synthase (glutamine-hydrolysing)
MCGITGVIAFTNEGNQYLDKIGDAVAALRHRGPDGEGIFRGEKVALGHTRLAIIDTSSAAAQPFTSTDGKFTIVFNGEIFNYRELRTALEKEGVQFRTESDTEVLLALFIRDRGNMLDRLNGFFAFAIWNHEQKNLFIARDRYGEKPLYCLCHDDFFAFGSEIKALLVYEKERIVQDRSLQYYLQLNYLPPWESMLKGIAPVQPGAFTVLPHRENARYVTKHWYELPNKNTIPVPSYAAARQKLAELLESAVDLRLVADVPVGSFLSGGIDSSIVAALAKKHKRDLETFSIGFADEPYFDETEFAEAVAKHIGSRHHVFSLRNSDLLDSLHEFLANCDEPFADSSALAVNILSKETRKHITVALSGDGADELFAGYNKHRAEFMVQQGGLRNSLLRSGKPLLDMLPASRNSTTGNRIRQLKRFSEGLALSGEERYWRWASYCAEQDADALLAHPPVLLMTEKKKKEQMLRDIISWQEEHKSINRILHGDMKLVLPGDMLVKVDRSSMLHGLEVRTPFLDYRLVEFVMGLPAEYKIDATEQKKILKDTFRDLLPAAIFTRRKQGFEVPLLKWFRNELRGLIDALLDEKFLREQNLFNPEAVKSIRKQMHSSNPGDSAARIWGLIVFQTWWKKYVHQS